MTNYWIIIAATTEVRGATIRGIDVFYRMMQAGRWGFGLRTSNAKSVHKGDKVVFYVAHGSGECSHCFVGTARVSKGTHPLGKQEKTLIEEVDIGNGGWPLKINLDSIHVWVDPVDIRPMIPNLTIVKRPDRWGSYLQGGLKKITEGDYRLITGGRKRRPFISTKELAKIRPRVQKRKRAVTVRHPFVDGGIAMNGRLYVHHEFKKEEDFEREVVRNASTIFGQDCFYFDLKRRIGSRSSVLSIPDGYVLDLTNLSDPRIHIIENELSEHDYYTHIAPQIEKFHDGYDMPSKMKIRDIIHDKIKADPQELKRLKSIIGSQNPFEVIDKAAFAGFSLIMVIDDETPLLKKRLEKSWKQVQVIVFESYRELGKKKGDLAHCFWRM